MDYFFTPEFLQNIFSVGGGPAAFGFVSWLMWHNGPKQAIEKLTKEVTTLVGQLDDLFDKHNELDKRVVRVETLVEHE